MPLRSTSEASAARVRTSLRPRTNASQGPLHTPRPVARRGREVDRQPDPRHTRRRQDRLPGRHSRHEPPAAERVPAGHRADKGRLLPDAGPERCRRQVSRIAKGAGRHGEILSTSKAALGVGTSAPPACNSSRTRLKSKSSGVGTDGSNIMTRYVTVGNLHIMHGHGRLCEPRGSLSFWSF
jgi:hypothetical protein